MKTLITVLGCMLLHVPAPAQQFNEGNGIDGNADDIMTQGKIIVGSKTFEVAYFDNATSDSLLDQMPFTVALEDYAGMEKIFYPKQALSKEGAPEGSAPTMGDIMYYAPWGDVAIFYKDFRYAAGLVPMGRISDIQGLMEALEREPTATFEN